LEYRHNGFGTTRGRIAVTNPPVSLNGRHCLVLDDDFLIALDIQQLLQAAGAIVTRFSTAAAAMSSLNRGTQFDVAVLDVKTGEAPHDSVAVAAALRSHGTPFVFLGDLNADEAQARAFPHAPVVEKPYQVEALVAALHEALRSGGGA
jgi:CheY-like chemotaxis protein